MYQVVPKRLLLHSTLPPSSPNRSHSHCRNTPYFWLVLTWSTSEKSKQNRTIFVRLVSETNSRKCGCTYLNDMQELSAAGKENTVPRLVVTTIARPFVPYNKINVTTRQPKCCTYRNTRRRTSRIGVSTYGICSGSGGGYRGRCREHRALVVGSSEAREGRGVLPRHQSADGQSPLGGELVKVFCLLSEVALTNMVC